MGKIAIIMGSSSDLETMQETINLLKEFEVGFEVKILSAHRTPKELEKYILAAPKKGVKVFIAAAGGAAALAGVVAAHTTVPVIGVPMETKSFRGVDSFLSTLQMPAGIPVACMSIGKAGAKNAALLALEILALNDKILKNKLLQYRKSMKSKILAQKIKF